MLPQIIKFVSVEKLRDGGSWAAAFIGGDGHKHILFSQIVFGNTKPASPGWEQLPDVWIDAKECFENENLGHAQPFLIHTSGRFANEPSFGFGQFSGGFEMISWAEAKHVMSVLKSLAESIGLLEQTRLEAMADVINREGTLAPNVARASLWFRP